MKPSAHTYLSSQVYNAWSFIFTRALSFLGTYTRGHLLFITFYFSATKEIQILVKGSVSGCMKSAKARTLLLKYSHVCSLTIGKELLCELDSFLNACHVILLPAGSICEYRPCFLQRTKGKEY
jgi:hypothetical protein